jgi:hypothetical protein
MGRQLEYWGRKLWIVETDRGRKRTWKSTATQAQTVCEHAGLRVLNIRPGVARDALDGEHEGPPLDEINEQA